MSVPPTARLKIAARRAAQGVGFRPFVSRVAAEIALTGWINNSTAGVSLEVEGPRGKRSGARSVPPCMGSRFTGRYRREGERIIPTISGAAHVTAEAVLLLNEDDPLCWGLRPSNLPG